MQQGKGTLQGICHINRIVARRYGAQLFPQGGAVLRQKRRGVSVMTGA